MNLSGAMGQVTADVDRRLDAADGGHVGADTTLEQPAPVSGGNRDERSDTETEITPQPILTQKELSFGSKYRKMLGAYKKLPAERLYIAVPDGVSI